MGDLPVVIAGAGIGGLTLALALAHAGRDCIIFEKAPELVELGAGIQLSPNASRILDGLGLGPALDQVSVRPHAVRLIEGRSDRLIAQVPLSDSAEARWEAPFRVVHRADLQSVLFQAVRERGIPIRLGHGVRGFTDTAEQINVQVCRDGEATGIAALALVGADGLRSAVRRDLGLDAEPRFAGEIAWRTVLPITGEADTRLWLGASAHLVAYPIRAGQFLNLVAVTRTASPHADREARARDLLNRAFRDWSPAVRTLIASADRWQPWPLFHRPPEPLWGRGRATLLGDAAHPMLPHLAQGAALAIEDAAVLAQHLTPALHSSVPTALRFYEKDRQPRTARAQAEAWRQGQIYHLPGLAAQARNTVLRMMSGERLQARMDWLYGYRVS